MHTAIHRFKSYLVADIGRILVAKGELMNYVLITVLILSGF
jgi:hypothetical protein